MKDPAYSVDQRTPYRKGLCYNIVRRSKCALIWSEEGEIIALKHDGNLHDFTSKEILPANVENISQLTQEGSCACQVNEEVSNEVLELWLECEQDHVVFNAAMSTMESIKNRIIH